MSISPVSLTAPSRQTSAPPRPLLALRGATAESRAGVVPRCAATVRVLDRVFFAVNAGDCVLVQHREPAQVRVLLAALAGRMPGGAITFRGTRTVRAGVRIRRASIRAELVPTLLAAWRSRSAPRTVCASGSAPVVHLLRASRGGGTTSLDHQAWSSWAAAQRAAGGALVIVADVHDLDAGPTFVGGATTPPRGASAIAPEVHEPRPAGRYARATNNEARTAGAVRACRFRHGRIEDVSAPSRRWSYSCPSEAPVVLGP
jgi:hypothetical protein